MIKNKFNLLLKNYELFDNPRLELSIIESLVCFIVICSFVMFFELTLGIFSAINAFLLSSLIYLLIHLFCVRRVIFPKRIVFLLVLSFLVFSLIPRANPFLYTWCGQDQGIYVAMSSQFERTGSTSVIDDVRANLSAQSKLVYDDFNQIKHEEKFKEVRVDHKFEGNHYPGLYIKDLAKSEYVFQFYPLHPLWMALFSKLFGDDNRAYSVVFFSLLNILILSLIAYELSQHKLIAGLATGILLSVNPMHVFFSRLPLTEASTLFFSATAFYFLILYFRSLSLPQEKPRYLLLSLGCWGCMFINHIGGFLYFPTLFVIQILGVLHTEKRSAFLAIRTYFSLILFLYGISVWYGINFSFPYSYETYNQIFGKTISKLYCSYWKEIISLLLVCNYFLCKFCWGSRKFILNLLPKDSFTRIFKVFIVVFFLMIFYISFHRGYGLTFSDFGKDHPEIQFNNSWDALFHVNLMALLVYVSPFILFFILIFSIRKLDEFNPFTFSLLVFLLNFILIRVGIEEYCNYYYYGRYLTAELLPYMIVMAAVLASTYVVTKNHRRLVVIGFIFSMIWFATILKLQFPGGMMDQANKSIKMIAQRVNDDDLLLIEGGKDAFPLKTALEHYYGKNVSFTPSFNSPEFISFVGNLKSHGDLYYLTTSANYQNEKYLNRLGSFNIALNDYRRGRFDIVPMGNNTRLQSWQLFNIDRKLFQVASVGKVFDFSENGNSKDIIGLGWSYQESEFRWSNGTRADLFFHLNQNTSSFKLDFKMKPFNNNTIKVYVNSNLKDVWVLKNGNFQNEEILIDKDDLKKENLLISFEIGNIISPHQLDQKNLDERQLGIALKSIVVQQ